MQSKRKQIHFPGLLFAFSPCAQVLVSGKVELLLISNDLIVQVTLKFFGPSLHLLHLPCWYLITTKFRPPKMMKASLKNHLQYVCYISFLSCPAHPPHRPSCPPHPPKKRRNMQQSLVLESFWTLPSKARHPRTSEITFKTIPLERSLWSDIKTGEKEALGLRRDRAVKTEGLSIFFILKI